ncbi:amino acid adenylation domain-containing protein [Marinicrinis sediminis]|uniref:Amino acid adenylation domain-containing protein n=1 Tax=Marinicrinis sediminis TaxID=1652465 RepID=A0ABW5RDI1_9BACL
MDQRLLSLGLFETAKQYWSKQLQDVEPFQLGLTRKKHQLPVYGIFEIPIEKEVAARLIKMGKSKDISVYVIILSMLSLWMRNLTGQKSFVPVSPLLDIQHTQLAAALTAELAPLQAEQEEEGEEDHLGWTRTGYVPFCIDLETHTCLKDMLLHVQPLVADGYKNQHYPLTSLTEQMGVSQQQGWFGECLVSMTSLHGERMEELILQHQPDWCLNIQMQADQLHLSLHYLQHKYESHVIEQYAYSLAYFMKKLITDVYQDGQKISLLEPDRQRDFVKELNQTTAPFSDGELMFQAFEKQARLQPDAIALTDGEQNCTYGQLQEQSNQLARHLQTLGVKSGKEVAIMLDRSFDMIIATLAVLKAGGSYVPLEPTYPRKRVETILNDLDISMVISKRDIFDRFQEVVWKRNEQTDLIYVDVRDEVPGTESLNTDEMMELWDHVADRADDDIELGGFQSSYTGSPFGETEVAAYVQHVVGLVQPHLHPGVRVLEVGCGGGHITLPLVRAGVDVHALDPSRSMLDAVQMRADTIKGGRLKLNQGFAHELAQFAEGTYDVIVMASTVQFFPGYRYLEAVIQQAWQLLRPGGTLLLSDIPSLHLKEAYMDSVAQYQQTYGHQPRAKTNFDTELYVPERFFTSFDKAGELTQLEKLEIRHRHDLFDNELQYRYDILLQKKEEGTESEQSVLTSQDERNRTEHEISEEQRVRVRYWTGWHVASHGTNAVLPATHADQKAYTIFTSGSTGTPKGVEVNHRSVVNLMEWVNGTFSVSARDRLLFVTSLCFDLSVYDIFGMLSAGGTIRMASEEEGRSPERLAHILASEPITFWDSAPAALQQLADHFKSSPDTFADSKLRLVFLSGDWIPLSLPDCLKATFPGVEVISLGGATEATVWSNFYRVRQLEEHWVSVPYGRPIQNARYYVLDEQLQPVPYLCAGQLYIAGDCLATGYTDEQLTRERFLPSPFAEGEKMYKTGDMARWLPDDQLEFMGRVDHQVKIRGFRVELGEIQTQLMRHPFVKEALVVDREEAEGHKSLAAYVVYLHPVSVKEMRDYLSRLLPGYMIPSYFVHLQALPLTSNGKLDRKALPDPGNWIETGEPFVEPRDEKERVMAEVWKKLLRVERVGIRDRFFDLGGNSMQIIQVTTSLSEKGWKIAVKDLFDYQTIEELAVRMEQVSDQPTDGFQEGEVVIHPNLAYSLSIPNNNSKHHWGMPNLYRIPVQLDRQAVQNAVQTLIQRHDALSIKVRETAEGWRQVIERSNDIPFQSFDLPPEEIKDEEVFPVIEARIRAYEDRCSIEEGPLFWVMYFDRGVGRESYVVYYLHHYCFDKYSLDILQAEMFELIMGSLQQKDVKLPPTTSTYMAFTEAMKRYANDERCEQHLAYWSEVAETDSDTLSIPVLDPNAKCLSRSLVFTSDRMPIASLLQAIQPHMKQSGIQMSDVLTAAFVRAYCRWSGKNRLFMNVFDNGRYLYDESLDLSRTVGWMASMYPVLYADERQEDLLDWIKNVKQQTAHIPKDNSYGLLRYVHDSKDIRDKMARIPYAQVNFNFQGQFTNPDQEGEAIAGAPEWIHVPPRSAVGEIVRDNLVLFNCGIEDQELFMDWDYSKDLHSAEMIEQWGQIFKNEIKRMTEALSKPIR